MLTLSSSEWVNTAHSLEEHHALFYQCWQMGKPRFDPSIPTAAVRFNRSGDFLEFVFNPDFWASLTAYERLFIIAHECLHVLLNHGLRTANTKDNLRTNWALDIVVNHMLVTNFGFDRSRLRGQGDWCWVDTIFADRPDMGKIPTDAAFEFYLNLIPQSPTVKVRLVDDHSTLPDDWRKVVGKLNQVLSPEELGTLKDAVERHCQDQLPGVGEGLWQFVNPGSVRKNKKWETVIKNWSKMYLRDVERNQEQWLRIDRRFASLQSGLFLPSEQEEVDDRGDRIEVYFFLDTSGSCYHLKDRFFRAAKSLPEERFKIRLFCFDDKVEETTLESERVYGGGGTRFCIIEDKIREVQEVAYPEAVFIITDGCGSHVQPLHPQRWHWFLTQYRSYSFIPEASKKYNLADYE